MRRIFGEQRYRRMLSVGALWGSTGWLRIPSPCYSPCGAFDVQLLYMSSEETGPVLLQVGVQTIMIYPCRTHSSPFFRSFRTSSRVSHGSIAFMVIYTVGC